MCQLNVCYVIDYNNVENSESNELTKNWEFLNYPTVTKRENRLNDLNEIIDSARTLTNVNLKFVDSSDEENISNYSSIHNKIQ